MKHSIYSLSSAATLAFLLLGASACTDDFTNSGREGSVFVTPTTAYLRMRSADLDFTHDGLASGPRTIRVESYGMPWTLTSSADWIKVSPSSGSGSQDVTVTVDEHTDADVTRHGTILLDYDEQAGKNLVVPGLSYRWEVPLTQQCPAARLSASMPEVSPGIAEMISARSGSVVEIPVTSNCEWSIKSFPSWLSASRLDDRLVVSVTEQNNFPESRQGTIRLNYNLKGGADKIKTYDIPITQDILHISAPAVKLRFERQGGVKTVEGIRLEGNTVISSPAWLHLNSNTQPDGRTTIEVHADANENVIWGSQRDTRRSGYIAISAKSGSGIVERARIEVEQDPRVFAISGSDGKTTDAVNGLVDYLRVPVIGDQRTVQVTTNSEFSVESGNAWLNVGGTQVREFEAPASGTKTYDIDLGTDYNDANGVRRRGWFYFKYPAVSDLLMVNQDGPAVSTDIDGSTWAFNSHPCDFSFTVEASAKWTAEFVNPDGSTPDWLRATSGSPGTGNVPGGEILAVHVDENNTGESRTCYMRLNVAGFKGLKYLITQYGNTIVSNGSILEFGQDGTGNHQIFLRTMSEPTVMCDADWVHVNRKVTSTAGVNDLKSYAYTVTVDKNQNYNPRNRSLIIKYSDNGQQYESNFTVVQNSYPIVLTFQGTTNFGDEGGSLTAFVSSESSAEIEVFSPDDWIKIGTPNSDSGYEITALPLTELVHRTGKVVARYKDDVDGISEKFIEISQWGPIVVDTDYLSFYKEGGVVNIGVTFPPSMSLSCYVNSTWISSSFKFLNNASAILTVNIPETEVERKGIIDISSIDGRCKTQIKIFQKLDDFPFRISLPEKMVVNNVGTSIPFKIVSEGSIVTYKSDSDFLHVNSISDGYVLIVDPNDSGSRTGKIKFSIPESTYTYNVEVIQNEADTYVIFNPGETIKEI